MVPGRGARLRQLHGAKSAGLIGLRQFRQCKNPGAALPALISGLSAFSSNGYQWFQVAEVGYDNFMARNSQS